MATMKVVILDPHSSQPLKGIVVEAHDISDGSLISTATTNDYGVAEFSLTVDASFHARTVNTPPLYQPVVPRTPPGIMNVDYVVASDGSGTHTTLAAAVAAAIATNADKTIWLCHSVTESDIDIGGLGASANLTISSHSPHTVVIAANVNEDIFKQDSTGGASSGGLHFLNVGFSIPTSNRAIYDCNTNNTIRNLTFDHCAFGNQYLARQDGNDSLGSIKLSLHGCIGTLAGFYKVEGISATFSPDILEAYDNDLLMTAWWDGGSQLAVPDLFDIDGGVYVISNALAFSNSTNGGVFQNLWIQTGVAAPLFTTGPTSQGIDDLALLNLTIRFTNVDGSFGNFGSHHVGRNDSLVIRGIFGSIPSELSSTETFLTIDSDWLNVHVRDIHAPDWATLYSGPSSSVLIPMIVVPTFEVQGNADGLGSKMVVIDALGSAWSALEWQRSGASRAAFGLWDTDGAAEFGANDLYFSVNDGSWHDVAAFKNDGTVFELNCDLNIEGWLQVGGDHATPPGNTDDGDLTATRIFGAVQLPRIGSPTYTHVEDMHTLFHSAGHLNGGEITVNGGDPTKIDVAAGQGTIRIDTNSLAQLKFFDWAAIVNQEITVDTIRYVGVEYNGGSPQVVIRTSENWNMTTDFPLGEVVNESGTLHITDVPWKVGDHARFMAERMHATAHIARDNHAGGLIFGETGARFVTVTSGTFWVGLTDFAIGAINTNNGDDFDTYSSKAASDGLEAAGVSQWPNGQYDNGGTLTNLGTNKWANLWWYLELDGGLVMVYGTAQYATQGQAEAETQPTTIPNRLEGHGTLASRFIFQEGAATAAQILSPFTTMFLMSGVTSHGDLADIGGGEDDHPEYLLADGSRALSAQWNPGAQVIGNFDYTAKPIFLTVGDANLGLVIVAGNPFLFFDGVNDALIYNRAANTFELRIGGTPRFFVTATGMEADVIDAITGSGLGVTVESVLLKDGLVDGVDIAARDHAEAHPPESHTGQGATAAELETLTDGSDADALHAHPAARSEHTYPFVPDAVQGEDVTVGDQQGILHHSGDQEETVTAVYLDAETAPTGASLIIEIEFGDTDSLDSVTSWTVIDTVTLTATNKSVKDSTPTQATLPANRLIRFNITQIGSTIGGQDVAAHMKVLRKLAS